MKQETKQALLSGILQNPVFVLGLALAPTVAMTTTLEAALMIGVCTFIVLFLSCLCVYATRKLFTVRWQMPVHILITATLTTVVGMFAKRWFGNVYAVTEVFISLILVNVLILTRMQTVAEEKGFCKTLIKTISQGFFFVLSLALFAFVREILGANTLTLFKVNSVFGAKFDKLEILQQVSGGLILLGLLIGLYNLKLVLLGKIKEWHSAKKEQQNIQEGEGK